MHVDVPRNIEETNKSQKVRLIADLAIIAPFLLYMSSKSTVTKTDKAIFVGIALATIWYNARNYINYPN
jgi:hypothetical protein